MKKDLEQGIKLKRKIEVSKRQEQEEMKFQEEEIGIQDEQEILYKVTITILSEHLLFYENFF